MYVTAILMFLLLISLIVSEKKKYTGLYSFDKATTLPLRGLLALMILSHHLGQQTTIYPLSNFTSGIGLQIVSVFFFISGYGLCVSYVAKKEGYIARFLHKRMGKLMPKFLLLTAGMIVYYQLFHIYDIEQQLHKFIQGWTPLPHSWFIYAIFYVYLSFYVCALIVKSPKDLGMIFTLFNIFYLIVMFIILHFPPYWYLTIISVNAGYFVALYEKSISTFMTTHKVYCFSILAVLLFASFCAMVKLKNQYIAFVFTESWIIAQAISVYAIIRALGFTQRKWLCNVGIISLELYLIHGIPLMIGKHMGLENWYLWLFTYAVSIPSALFLNWSYDRLMQRWAILKA